MFLGPSHFNRRNPLLPIQRPKKQSCFPTKCLTATAPGNENSPCWPWATRQKTWRQPPKKWCSYSDYSDQWLGLCHRDSNCWERARVWRRISPLVTALQNHDVRDSLAIHVWLFSLHSQSDGQQDEKQKWSRVDMLHTEAKTTSKKSKSSNMII